MLAQVKSPANLNWILFYYLDEVDTLDDVEIDDDVDTELDVDTLNEKKRLLLMKTTRHISRRSVNRNSIGNYKIYRSLIPRRSCC